MKHSIQSLKILSSGILSLILTLGIARFSYTPLLPLMQEETWLNHSSGGWLATFNYMGYMLGAFIVASINDLQLKDKLYRIGLIIAVLSTAGMALTDNMIVWSGLRFIAGLSSAAGLLLGSGLILHWLIRHHYRHELGIHFSGLGLGIILSAVVINTTVDSLDWSQQWIVLALLGLVILFPAWLWLPPPDMSPTTISGQALKDKPPQKKWILLLLAVYFCAGFGYVISATFLVVIVEQLPNLSGYGDMAWLMVGIAAAPACFFWDLIARKIGEIKALQVAFLVQIIGVLLPAVSSNLYIILLSAFLYGATFIGIVSLVLTMVGRLYPSKPSKLMGKLTLSYGAAQIIAPALSGIIAQISGSYNFPLYLAAIVLSIGVFILNKMKHLNNEY